MARIDYDNNTHMMRGMKIRIYPDEYQASLIDERINISIAVYNWAINCEKEQYELYKSGKSNKKFLSYYDLIYKYTDFRNNNECSLILPYGSAEKAIHRAYIAFEMFFKTKNRFPKYKSKKKLRKMSYGVRHDTMYIDDNMVRIEGFPRGNKIYSKYHTKFRHNDGTRYYNPVITKDRSGRYYISFSIIVEKLEIKIISDILSNPIGIDLNVKDRFVCSNGYRSGSPNINKLRKRYRKAESASHRDIRRRLKEAKAKSLKYTDIIPSKRAEKRMNKKRKIADKIANITETFIQEQTCKIIKMNPSIVIMEDLSVDDMKKNHKVAHNLCEYGSSFNRCITVMKSKCEKFSIPFKQAGNRFPSSMMCSNCGHIKKISSQKIYKCSNCGMVMDRDLNAAINLMNLAAFV